MQKYFYYGLVFLTLCTEANADVIYESAKGSFDIDASYGGSFIASNQFIGAVFNINETTQIDGIGGHFNNGRNAYNGSIFGALVSLNSNGLPEGSLTELKNVIAYSVFTPDSGKDTFTSLSTTLSAGNYGLVFGSGLFGASGTTLLTLSQFNSSYSSSGDVVSISGSNLSQWKFATEMKNSNRYRMIVSGTTIPAVPEADTYAMLLLGLGVLGFMTRRKEV